MKPLMPYLFTLTICAYSLSSFAQKEMKPTTSFVIKGKVKNSITISESDLKKLKTTEIGDVVITNHLGESKNTAKAMKGVLLTDVLKLAEIDAENPKVLSEYYFVCKATDNYIVVYSWNELFNSAIGETTYIVTEKDGKAFDKMNDSVLMISSKDFRTGRRNVKALASIEVKRAD